MVLIIFYIWSMYFNSSFCHSSKLRERRKVSLTGKMVAVACGWMGRVRLMKEPCSDQRRENEMAFDLVGCRRVLRCHRSAK